MQSNKYVAESPTANDDENDDTVELPDDEFDTTRDEDYEDFTEMGIRVKVHVRGSHGPPSKEEFEKEIVPELKTTVIQYILEQEEDGAFPEEDFRFYGSSGHGLIIHMMKLR